MENLNQLNNFQLHALLPELEVVLRMLHNNFMKIDENDELTNVDANDKRQ